MSISAWLIKKPIKEESHPFDIKDYTTMLKNPTYLAIWIIFYLNITCGLALISFEKGLGLYAGITNIGILAAFTALFNTIGRFGYSTSSDYFSNKAIIYIVIFFTSILAMIGARLWVVLIPASLCIINAGYGGGFSTLPTLLQSKFGMNKISTIHGLALSAWAFAGLSGNQLSKFILDNWNYDTLFIVLFSLYSLSFFITNKYVLK
jgi:OFA family oxalate/formate antiporter-like MFS transporter